MPPKTLLVMRHAEKSGDPADPDLSPEGRVRAEALASYIPETFGTPDFIFATALSNHSARPIETVQPLAKQTGVPIDSSFADQDYGALAQELLSKSILEGETGLVCWHHGNIPNLMHALGAPADSYPDPWPRDVFNLILKVSFSAAAITTVDQITEPF